MVTKGCMRCKKEKESEEFTNEQQKIFEQCNICREDTRKKKQLKYDLSKKSNITWKDKNQERIKLYKQHQTDLRLGKESNWEQVLLENGLELNNSIGKPSPKRKEHIFDENGNEGKECSCCKEWKKLDLYCKNKYSWDNLRHECNHCLTEYRKKNKERMTEYNKKYWEKTQEEQKEKSKIWRQNNQEHIKEKYKEYRLLHGKEIDKKQWQKRKNDEEYRSKHNDYINKLHAEKRKTDINFKLKQNVSRRIREVLTNFSLIKSERTIEYVGCNLQDLRVHLESTFKEGMTWENYGEWHIDHIIPCSSWNLADKKELKMCFHYSNLQALWASENIHKKDNYKEEEKIKYIQNFIFNFETIN